jgi:cytochrome c biogenesis protein CcmG, thiol:disulfide interchange protein DsbE
MKNKILLFMSVIFFSFCFIVLYEGLDNSNIYTPKDISKKTLNKFVSREFFSEDMINSEEIFFGNKFYILNIWASWCLPCREEHPALMKLSKKQSVKLIGLNYKDDIKNAKKFIDKFGNPYSIIITDVNGTISIGLGAYGIPETFVIDENKKILKKYIGPLNDQSIKEINLLLK